MAFNGETCFCNQTLKKFFK